MDYDTDKIDEYTLALLYLVTHQRHEGLGARAWKGFDWDTMNRLHDKGYISNPVGKAKSVGHVFQGRYKAILVQKETHLLEVCRYVVLNPVRAKVVESPERWRWSSYRAMAGMEKPHPCITTEWLLGQFASGRRKAEKRYREFVHDGINKRTIWDDVKGQSILGERDFVDQLIDYVRGYEEAKEIPKGQRYVNRPSLGDIFKDTKRERGKRNREIADAVDRWGYSQKEVADHLRLHYSTISRLINEGNLNISKLKTPFGLCLKAGHTHGLPIAFYNIIIGSLLDRLTLSDKWKKICSIFTILSFIMPVGLLLRGITDGAMTFAPVVLIGSLCFFISALIMVKGSISNKTA